MKQIIWVLIMLGLIIWIIAMGGPAAIARAGGILGEPVSERRQGIQCPVVVIETETGVDVLCEVWNNTEHVIGGRDWFLTVRLVDEREKGQEVRAYTWYGLPLLAPGQGAPYFFYTFAGYMEVDSHRVWVGR